MSRIFHRIVSFEVEGEVYDHSTKPEDIIKNYDWHFKDFNDGHGDDKCFLEASHFDHRGRIIRMTKQSKIQKTEKPDIEFLISTE
jgi:hypothetical protein